MRDAVVVVSATGDSFDVLESMAFGSAAVAVPFAAVGRSSQWPALARETVERNPECACCRAKRDLQPHHIRPFHVFPELELDRDNLIVLCRRCHLFVGHLGWWSSWNPAVRADAATWRTKIDARPTKQGE